MAHYKSQSGCKEARQYRFGANGETTVVACPPCEKPSVARTFGIVILGVIIGDYISARVRQG